MLSGKSPADLVGQSLFVDKKRGQAILKYHNVVS